MKNDNTPSPKASSPVRPVFFKKRDVLLVALLLLAAAIFLAFALAQPQGALATITTTREGQDATVQQIRLGKDDTIVLGNTPFPVTLEIKNGAIRFASSQCPDHNCEGFGWLRLEGEWALCAPAGVMVRIAEN